MGKVVSMRPGPPESKEQWFKRKVSELGKALGKLPASRRRLVHMSLNDGEEAGDAGAVASSPATVDHSVQSHVGS